MRSASDVRVTQMRTLSQLRRLLERKVSGRVTSAHDSDETRSEETPVQPTARYKVAA
jgi:hypothetical protein